MFWRWLKSIVVATVVLVTIGGAAFAYLWHSGALQRWAEGRLLEMYVREFEGKLPFKIEKIEIEKNWRDLLSGKIHRVHLILRRDDVRADLSGPVRLKHFPSDKEFRIEYWPEARVEILSGPMAARLPAPPSAPMKLHLWFEAARDLSRIDDFGLSAEATRLDWPALGARTADLKLAVNWDRKNLRLAAEASSLSYQSKDPSGKEQVVQVEAPRITASSSLLLGETNRFGPGIEARLDLKSAEALWGDLYLSPPKSFFPVQASVMLPHGQLKHYSGKLTLGNLPLKLEGDLVPAGSAFKRARLKWKLNESPLRDWIQTLLDATQGSSGPLAKLGTVRDFDLRRGRIESEGQASFPLGGEKIDPTIEGRIALRDVGFRYPKAQLAIRGGTIEAPFSLRSGMDAWVSAEEIYFRKAKASLARTGLTLRRRSNGFQLLFGDHVSGRLPLNIEGLPLKIGAIRGAIDADGPDLLTSLDLPTMPIRRLLDLACVKTGRLPPASFHLRFPNIELTEDSIDITGKARLELFEGYIEVGELGFYDLFSAVPETDFTLDADGIRLDRLGEWLGFGEMDGILKGHAHDVVFQSWLPTQYDFKLEVKPFNRWKVVFSPDAMKNFVRLFAADGIDQLPGVADWLAFGWPSRVFGGYDVLYAGLSLYSAEGRILLETLDPPSILSRERKRFILYGPRFKMPLRTARYPLVVDAVAMGNFVHQMALTLQNMAAKKASEKSAKTAEKPEEKRQDEPLDCNPPEIVF